LTTTNKTISHGYVNRLFSIFTITCTRDIQFSGWAYNKISSRILRFLNRYFLPTLMCINEVNFCAYFNNSFIDVLGGGGSVRNLYFNIVYKYR